MFSKLMISSRELSSSLQRLTANHSALSSSTLGTWAFEMIRIWFFFIRHIKLVRICFKISFSKSICKRLYACWKRACSAVDLLTKRVDTITSKVMNLCLAISALKSFEISRPFFHSPHVWFKAATIKHIKLSFKRFISSGYCAQRDAFPEQNRLKSTSAISENRNFPL